MSDELTLLQAMTQLWEPVGSRVTCSPIPETADHDVFCLLNEGEDMGKFVSEAEKASFTYGGSHVEDKEQVELSFVSLRRSSDQLNIIATRSKVFADRFLLATYVCKYLNVLVKEHRIVIFQAILYGKKWTPATG